MADITHDGHTAHATGRKLSQYTSGMKSWLTTVDHKRIGIMYLASILFFFFVGGVLALLVRIELLTPKQTIMTAEQYNQVFTLHGVIMVFLFIIPSVPAALGNFVMPLMLGAKDVAFPRLNLMSLYIYWTGAVMAVSAILLGGVDTGWTFYTPYSTSTGGAVSVITLAAFVLGFSSILTGVNFIATIHKLRAPGMGWFQLPLFVWSMYATALIQVMATPVLGDYASAADLERMFHIGIFDPQAGRRPGSVPALLLVLLAPGRLHHDRAGLCVYLARSSRCSRRRRSSDTKAIAFSSVSPSRSSASWSGATTCSSAASRLWPAPSSRS